MIAATETARISAAMLQAQFADTAEALLASGLLDPDGATPEVSMFTEDGEVPVSLSWSPDHSAYGYFDPLAGWVSVAPDALASFRLNLPRVITCLLEPLDRMGHGSLVELVPDVVWEAGTYRLPQRTKPVPIWVTRGLDRPSSWNRFAEMARLRPSPDLRLVLNLGDLQTNALAHLKGHELVAAPSVMNWADGLKVDPTILAARIAQGPVSLGPVWMTADGAVLTIYGKQHQFKGGKQQAVVRQLYAAWCAGNPECLTHEVLEHAEVALSVRRLKDLFKGHQTWKQAIQESGGHCSLIV